MPAHRKRAITDKLVKPFLKWPGGKFRLIREIHTAFSRGHRLIEPFTGSAAVFLNTDFNHYLLADSNPDLIEIYRHLVEEGEGYLRHCRAYFTADNNTSERYYPLRDRFNRLSPGRERAAIFLYLNRHCYNGLCRYNSKGEFNTPFGRYTRPYFPEQEMRHFVRAASRARFLHAAFTESMQLADKGDVVYCDPPYAPLSRTANFTDYQSGGFKWADQLLLAETAARLATRGARVVISNHDTKTVRDLYRQAGARIRRFQARRSISCNPAKRNKVGELLAIFG